MRHNFLISTAILSIGLLFSGCNSVDSKGSGGAQKSVKQPAPATTHADGVRRMTVRELHDLMKKGQVFIVDVRNLASYDAGHLPGSKLIPHTEILNHLAELPRDKTIVTYCS